MKKQNRLLFIIICLHFALTFLFERCTLLFGTDSKVVAAVARNSFYSDRAEQVVGYVLSKLFALTIIIFLWVLVSHVIRNIKNNRLIRMFTIVFMVGIPFLIFLWPDIFMRSPDNLITYSYAIRFFPEYWHNAFSSTIFAACMMVIPHPFSIGLFQWMLFVFDIAYVCIRANNCTIVSQKTKFLVPLILLIPESFYLFTDAYRTEQYALVCIPYITLIVFDAIENKKRSNIEIICILLLSAFVATWRTEGVILAFFGVLSLVFVSNKSGIKKGILLLISFGLIFAIINIPQKLGDAKYYGKDYSIINSFPSLRNILNSETSDFSYEGSEEDVAALDEVVPVYLLQLGGLEGYHSFNVSEGRKDINQSMASNDNAGQYMKAYYRIVMHNPIIYVKTQLGMLKRAILLTDDTYVEKLNVVRTYNIPEASLDWEYDAWDVGKSDLMESFGVSSWYHNNLRLDFTNTVLESIKGVGKFLKNIYFQTIIIALVVLYEIIILIKEIFLFAKRSSKAEPRIILPALGLIALAAAIIMVMPAGVLGYFHAFLYSTVILEIVYTGLQMKKYENRRKEKI